MKNIPFFSPTALRSLKKDKEEKEKDKKGEEKGQKDEQFNDNVFLNSHIRSCKPKLFGKTITKLFTL